MKHYLRNIMLIGGIVFQTALCDAATNFEVEENMKKEIQVTAANTYKFEKQEGNSAVKAKNFVIKKGAELRAEGKGIEKAKNVRAVYVEGNRFSTKMEIMEGAKVIINLTTNSEDESLSKQKIDRSIAGFKDRPLEGMYVRHTSKPFEIKKEGELNIKTYDNQLLQVQKKGKQGKEADEEHDESDLFHQLLRKSAGLSMDADLVNSGNLNIESTGIGIKNGNFLQNKKMDFKEGSETNIRAGLIAIGAGRNKITFENGSKATLIGGSYGLIAKEATFKKGSKVTAMGKYGLGNFDYKGNGDKYIFESGSEIDIFANETGLYALNLGGAAKILARGKNVLKTCNTRERKEGFTFEKGSILEGNITHSYGAKLFMEEGTKFFVNDQIEANVTLKGDLYVGPREAYETLKRKNYVETAKDLDLVAGASVLLFKNSNQPSIEDLNGRAAYEDVSSDKYYEANVNKVKNNTSEKSMLNLQGATVHLRAGGTFEEQGVFNDKLIFSKNAEIKGDTKLIIHPTNVSGIQRNMTFDLLEEEKKMETGEFDLEGMKISLSETELGPLVFARKDRKLEDRYIISLSDTGKLSKAAIQSMNLARDSHEWNMKELQGIQHTIFAKKDQELRENFWILSSHENFINKETDRKWKQNSLYAGYDYTFSPKLSLGFFAGQSTGGMKSIAQGIYFRKSLAPFYVGGMVKRTELKQEEKRNHSGDISFIVGHVWDKKSKLYVNNSFALTRGHVSSSQYIEGNGMHTEREKFNYVDGEFHSRLGYNFTDGSLFMEVGLGKHILGKQRILWNGNVQEELKHDGLRKRIGIGGQWKIKHHGIDMKISKEYSKYYKSNMKVSLGYSYSF
ncbi:hypothetical protein [Fusobacterium necrophorum]|uniref:hypothetical protein n=1 Tax=Fusobacterium necrophorum TaxID=859 RepID=UPI00078865BD|nr:hypothetical protein [Fusobacterium necrophorum]KYM46828.1 autotransporter outer membrane beta-barrel domain-containing protein [Fusobacterium necrophorum subsp. funduliforme]